MQHGWAMCSMWPYWRRQQVDSAAAKGAVVSCGRGIIMILMILMILMMMMMMMMMTMTRMVQ